MRSVKWNDRKRAIRDCALLHFMAEIDPVNTPTVREWFTCNVSKYADVKPNAGKDDLRSPMYNVSSEARKLLNSNRKAFERAAFVYFVRALQVKLFSEVQLVPKTA